MRVVIAGAGSVGRSIARELVAAGHEVLIMDRSPAAMRIAQVPDADWQLGDACDLGALEEAQVSGADVTVAATGDDQANLVISLLAKTEFGVPRTVARVNNPRNEWLFDGSWGVDVAVSTPRVMTSMIEEAVSVGDVVSVFTFNKSGSQIFEITLPTELPVIGRLVGSVDWPQDVILAAMVRDGRPFHPSNDDTFEAGDELMFLAAPGASADALQAVLRAEGPSDSAAVPVY